MAGGRGPQGPRGKLKAAAVWWAEGFPGADVESYVADLRASGWDEDAIDEERRLAEELAEPAEIWPENWPIVDVFFACSWAWVSTLDGLVRTGIDGAEILAKCHLRRVPRTQWADIDRGVRVMVDAALPLLNRKDS